MDRQDIEIIVKENIARSSILLADAFNQTFCIKTCLKSESEIGTCFLMKHSNKEYLITAKHLFRSEGYLTKSEIQIFENKAWTNYPCTIHYHYEDMVDIAVLEVDLRNKCKQNILTWSRANMALSQDMYFCGFPYKIINVSWNTQYPIPVVKKGILACIEQLNGVEFLLLDGHNNLGFSGGPVIYKQIVNGDYSEYICGVISRYKVQENFLMENEKGEKIFTEENSGIIEVCSIKHAIEIIDTIK